MRCLHTVATKSFLLVLRVPSLELTQESWVLYCALQLKKLLLIITMSWSASKTLFALGLLCCGLTTSCHVNSNGKIINMVTLLTEVSNQGIYLGYWFSSPWACLRFISWAPTEKKSALPTQYKSIGWSCFERKTKMHTALTTTFPSVTYKAW